MSLLPSFRSRFISGSLLWGAGLLLLSHIISVIVVVGSPAFRGMPHIAALLATSLLFMAGGLWLARSGLTSFNELRTGLAAVHEGREPLVKGVYPTEVQPLVDDLNALLDHRDKRVRAALAKAGDLAHGLKTPLAVLAQEGERADAAGQTGLAATLRQQVERMHRQVDYHLAHARAAASGATPGARASVAESAEALARTLRQLHAERRLTIEVSVPLDHGVRGEREDLGEMLGNLLDNACKWAASRVAVQCALAGDDAVITVDDDGPGLPSSMREVVLQRGVRADEAAAGSGLGLAIVSDVAELYGGSIALGESPMGGLQLPAAAG